MGCLFHKCVKHMECDSETLPVKQYSWDKKKSIDPKDFTLEDVVNSEIWKMPGSLNGQQFVIQNCKNSTIYVLDHTNMITLDDCIGCKIILGPVKGSVFIRDCKECVCVVACGQFRLRDCRKLDIFLSCATQPIMESSSNIHFGCYQLHYTGIEDHFKAASLSLYNNSWSNIHDFTPSHGGDTNWCILPNTMSITDYLNPPYNYGNVKISLMKEDSVVPFTAGIHAQPSEESETCLVVFFFDGREEMMALNFIRKFNEHRPDAVLLTTKQISMEPRDAEIVFGTSTYNRVAVNGPLIGLICSGKRVIYSCQKIVDEIAQGSDRAYVSDNPRTAVVQAETFASIATMHLAS